MNRNLFASAIFFGLLGFAVVRGQSPAPVAMTAPPADTMSLPEAVRLLQEMKAANAEVLKKQEAALQQLDELAKAADEIKIFSKRS